MLFSPDLELSLAFGEVSVTMKTWLNKPPADLLTKYPSSHNVHALQLELLCQEQEMTIIRVWKSGEIIFVYSSLQHNRLIKYAQNEALGI